MITSDHVIAGGVNDHYGKLPGKELNPGTARGSRQKSNRSGCARGGRRERPLPLNAAPVFFQVQNVAS